MYGSKKRKAGILIMSEWLSRVASYLSSIENGIDGRK